MALARTALASGGRQLGPTIVEWDIAGRCLFPVRRELWAKADRPMMVERLEGALVPFDRDGTLVGGFDRVMKIIPGRYKTGFSLLLTAKCRRCDKCRRERSKMWMVRARQECALAKRTWLGTLTLSPQNHEHFANLARSHCSRHKRVAFEELTLADQFDYRHRMIAREITLMFKRWRKAGWMFRYLLVCEVHKSGLPHYHLLLHEIGDAMTWRTLVAEWRLGFCSYKLVEGGAATYVCKYLGKATTARVRASVAYGRPRAAELSPQAQDGCPTGVVFPVGNVTDPQKATVGGSGGSSPPPPPAGLALLGLLGR